MAHRDGASSVQGSAIRITRLNVDGTIDTDFPVLTTRGFISATFSPEFEEGDEIAEKRADGGVCISWKADDTLKRLNFSLSLCSPDPEAAALLAGGKIICDPNGAVVGYTSPMVGSVVGNPVGIEIWSIANVGGKPAAGTPYWHWVFPYVKVRYEGDREFGNSALLNEFSGQALGNGALVPDGLNPINPDDDWVTYKAALENPFSYVRSEELPPFGWAEGQLGSGNEYPTDADNALSCDVSTIPTSVVAAAPTAGPSSEPEGSIIVDSATGAVWITRAGNWVDAAVTVTPIPGQVDIVLQSPLVDAPSGDWDGDLVWWDDGTDTYKAFTFSTSDGWDSNSDFDVSKT